MTGFYRPDALRVAKPTASLLQREEPHKPSILFQWLITKILSLCSMPEELVSNYKHWDSSAYLHQGTSYQC